MKKIRIVFSIVVLGIILLSANSCKKATDLITTPDDNCNDLLEAYSAALNAYIVDQTEENCEAYVDALTNYVNGCAILSTQQRQQYNSELDDIDCSQ